MPSKLSFFQNGEETNPPREYPDISINALFGESQQGSIETDQLTFVGESAQKIYQYIQGGLDGSTKGIFQGIPYKIQGNTDNGDFIAFDGLIETFNGLQVIEPRFGLNDLPVEIKARIKAFENYDDLLEKAEGISMLFLADQGLLTGEDLEDLPFVLEREVGNLELAILIISITSIILNIIQLVKDTAESIRDTVALATTGILSPLTVAIYIALTIAINIFILAIQLRALVSLVVQIINVVWSPLYAHKVISYEKIMTAIANYGGFKFETDIPNFDRYKYLPSSPFERDGSGITTQKNVSKGFGLKGGGGVSGLFPQVPLYNIGSITPLVENGLPRESDFGYIASDFMTLMKRIFKVDFAILNGTLHMRNVKSSWWNKQSDYVLPDVIDEVIEYNTNELQGTRVYSHSVDPNDEFTISNYKGTSYEVKTYHINPDDQKLVGIKGLKEVNTGVALPTRKDSYNEVEISLIQLVNSLGVIAQQMKLPFNLNEQITERIGVMKVSSFSHTVPKIIYLNEGLIPENYREFIGWKGLYESWHTADSFVEDNYYGQKVLINNKQIPFSLENLMQMKGFSQSTSFDGSTIKFTKLEANQYADTASVSYYKREPYDKNLVEKKIEA
jgi:hypothetical protein